MEKRFHSQDLSFMCKTYGAVALYLLLFGWLVSVWEESLAIQLSGGNTLTAAAWITWLVLAGELLLHLVLIAGLLIWKRREKQKLEQGETAEFYRLVGLIAACNLAMVLALTLTTWRPEGALLMRLLPPFLCAGSLARGYGSLKQKLAAWGFFALSLALAAVFPGVQYLLENFGNGTLSPEAALAAGWCSMVAYRLMPAVGYGLCALTAYRQRRPAGRRQFEE